MMNSTRVFHILTKREQYKNYIKSLEVQYYSESDILKYQERKLSQLWKHCLESVPYYQDLGIDDLDMSTLENFPLLTKSIVNSNFENLTSQGIPVNDLISNSTSGSTGKSMKFYTYAKNYTRKSAHWRGDNWAGWEFGMKTLSLWGAERDFINSSKIKLFKSKWIHKQKILSSYHLSDLDLKDYVDTINDFKPGLIVSYPTPLAKLCEFINDNKIEIHKPLSIICSAETLYPFQRDLIEETFRSRIFNRYGNREFGHVASECEHHNGLHVNMDRFILEVVDSSGATLEPGNTGEIVITDLDSFGFPFIRYKTGDIGSVSFKKCGCGRFHQKLNRIEGRTFDLIKGLNGNVVAGTFWTLLRNVIPGWREFQVRQDRIDVLDFIVVKNEEIARDFEQLLKREVSKKLGDSMKINVEYVDKIPLTKSGKHRWVISTI